MTHRLEEPSLDVPPAVEVSPPTIVMTESLLGVFCLEAEGIEVMLALTEDWGADGE